MRTNDNHGRLLSIGAMAGRIGVPPKELRSEAEAGTIPHVRVGERGLLFDPVAVMAALEARAKKSAEASPNYGGERAE